MSGRKMIFLLLVAGAGFAARFIHSHELPPLARESILLRLKADYSAPLLAKHSAQPQTRANLTALASALEQSQRIGIIHADARGLLWPKYVRVEVSVDGKEPPDGRVVRYFTIDLSGAASANVSGSKYYLSIW